MFTRDACVAMLLGCVFSLALNGQTPTKVDFGRDVLPIFRQSCIGCHGPSQKISNLRLDRRSGRLLVHQNPSRWFAAVL
jgi:hypothetical protein